MQVRHNTSLLEEAVQHVVRRAAIPLLEAEASAEEKRARAASFRRLATGGAIALAAVGLGLGVSLGFFPGMTRETLPPAPTIDPAPTQPDAVAQTDPEPVPEVEPTELPPIDTAKPVDPADELSKAAPDEPVIVTEQFTKFSEKAVTLFGNTWPITAGHYFESETDPTWQSAWCYTRRDVGGVSVNVALADRASPDTAPIGPLASPETLAQVGLSGAAALALAAECAWLDQRKFSVGSIVSPAGEPNPFVEEPVVKIAGDVLTFEGVIDETFLQRLEAENFRELRIESAGGLVDQALAAGYWLRETGKDVRVIGDCLSACALVVAGGNQRGADESARIGVHRFYSDARLTDAAFAVEIAQEKASEIVRFLDAMGIDTELFHAMARVPSNSMEFLAAYDLHAWQLLNATNGIAAEVWFNGLSNELRRRLQTDLTLLGYYNVFIDEQYGAGTSKAITTYQRSVGVAPDGVLAPELMSDLHKDAATVFRSLGFEPIEDTRGESIIFVPTLLLPNRVPTNRGTMFSSSSGDITLDTVSKPAAKETLLALFKSMSAPSQTRSVAYATSNANRFVISGTDRGKAFYTLFYSAGVRNVGFSLSWDLEQETVGAVAAMFISSHFVPFGPPNERTSVRGRLAEIGNDYRDF